MRSSSGNGSSVAKTGAANAVSGPISTKRDSRTAPPGSRRVAAQAACEWRRWAGWASSSPASSAQNRKRSRKRGAEDDVVVDDEQPVVAGGRMLGEQRVEVLELAGVAHRDRVHVHLVARAVKLGAQRGHQPAGPLDAEHEHAAPGRRRARGAVDPAQARARLEVERGVERAQRRAAQAAHGAALAGEEVRVGLDGAARRRAPSAAAAARRRPSWWAVEHDPVRAREADRVQRRSRPARAARSAATARGA